MFRCLIARSLDGFITARSYTFDNKTLYFPFDHCILQLLREDRLWDDCVYSEEYGFESEMEFWDHWRYWKYDYDVFIYEFQRNKQWKILSNSPVFIE